ncbi:MAG TPA: metalloregulator ArsR/SmtB family transcription factor [Propionibacteriaceae bacterium]|nr:metalloregulator ArsR/SmtB family transcription factor [Propionibacteriaceae bacterium]
MSVGRRRAALPSSDPDASTRQRVTQSILEHGPSTAAVLAGRLGLTAAAVRRHLDVLLDRGHLVAREQRVYGTRGRGRPAKVFALTDEGRAAFYSAYDDIAIQALEFLADQVGPDAVSRFARAQAEVAGQRYTESMAAANPDLTPANALAGALTSDGFVASVRPSALGEQLCQHHCPVAHVAERFPQLCEVETDLFSKLLGVHVQRLATIAHGDGVCTTHVPARVRQVTPAAGSRAAGQPNNSTTEDAVLNDGPATDSQPTTAIRTTLREPLL